MVHVYNKNVGIFALTRTKIRTKKLEKMSKFINEHIAWFVIIALLAAAAAIYMAIKNRKSLTTCPGGESFSPAEKAKLDRLTIDDHGNVSGTPVNA